MTAPLVLSMVGYAVLLAVDVEKQKGIGYMAIFFCTIGVSGMIFEPNDTLNLTAAFLSRRIQ
jgi:hypothetical protein